MSQAKEEQQRIVFRLNPQEQNWINNQAKSFNLSPNAYCKEMSLRGLGEKNLLDDIKDDCMQELRDIAFFKFKEIEKFSMGNLNVIKQNHEELKLSVLKKLEEILNKKDKELTADLSKKKRKHWMILLLGLIFSFLWLLTWVPIEWSQKRVAEAKNRQAEITGDIQRLEKIAEEREDRLKTIEENFTETYQKYEILKDKRNIINAELKDKTEELREKNKQTAKAKEILAEMNEKRTKELLCSEYRQEIANLKETQAFLNHQLTDCHINNKCR